MSTIIMNYCWPLQGMTVTQKAVLISLADNANDEGVCWPSIEKIAQRTCLSVRAVRNAIKWLEENQLLQKTERYGRSNIYTITPASYAPLQEMQPCTLRHQPRQQVHPTPAPAAEGAAYAAPRTINNPQRTTREPSTSQTFTIPDWLPKESWQLWERFRKRVSGKAWTTDAKHISLESLEQLYQEGHDPTVCIKQSIERGWTGLFAPKNSQGINPHTVSSTSFNRQEALEEQNHQVALEWIKKMQEIQK